MHNLVTHHKAMIWFKVQDNCYPIDNFIIAYMSLHIRPTWLHNTAILVAESRKLYRNPGICKRTGNVFFALKTKKMMSWGRAITYKSYRWATKITALPLIQKWIPDIKLTINIFQWSASGSGRSPSPNVAWNISQSYMMASLNGNIFHVIGHLCGEFTSPRWIPRTKASDAEFWCFLWCTSE